MFALFTRSMCCSVRDKEDGRTRSFGMGPDMAHFAVNEVELDLEKPSLMAFSPLWQSNAVCVRRLALASERVVNVYNLSGATHDPLKAARGTGAAAAADSGMLHAEGYLALEEGQEVTSLIFRDEDTSRHLLVAYGPASGSGGPADPGSSQPPAAAPGRYYVRVWACESDNSLPSSDRMFLWRQDSGYIASLEEHSAPVKRMAVSSTYLLTADSSGECRVWQKSRNFAHRAVARLHQTGGISDLAVDRLFAYSVGGQDLAIRVWSMPELKQVLTISADTAECSLVMPMIEPASSVAVPPCPPCRCRLSQLTAVRRPASRWSGAQASTRNSGIPRGMLFVAGTVAEKQDGGAAACAGSGVLMEWALGANPSCQSAQLAHETPIVALAYGPYDNGPLVTADAWGVFRIWDYTPRLWCSQQVETSDLLNPSTVAISVDPLQRTLYSVVGGKRLCLWRQNTGSPADGAA